MPNESFRFLHAGEFHLDRPLSGFTEIPDGHRDILVDAPYDAARRVFETALSEKAAFVVLSGDIVDPRSCGARPLAFLIEQFQTLEEAGIGVYWAGGTVDPPDRWPDGVDLPEGVHLFGTAAVEELSHFRGERALATIVGISSGGQPRIRTGEFQAGGDGLFTIAVAHGTADPIPLESLQVDYWALGGRHERHNLLTGARTAHYSGTPQGRTADESGPHGCTLVHVENGLKCHMQFIATDSVRWAEERVRTSPADTTEDLKRQLAQRMQQLVSESDEQPLLVAWTVENSGRLGSRLRQEGLAEEILDWLRNRFGERTPLAWPASLVAAPPTAIPESLREEETILGDFLREVELHQKDGSRTLDIKPLLGERQINSALAAAVDLTDTELRREVLEQAAQLGVDLLSGEDTVAWLGE